MTLSKSHSSAAERNREPILRVLERVFPKSGTVLELASGTGQHAVFFAAALTGLFWQPSETDPHALRSIIAWRVAEGAANVRAPLRLDVTADAWPLGTVEAMFNANMIHIAPWEACLGLLRGAGRHLAPGGVLVLYGPYKIGGRHTAPSNAAFDLDLRARDRCWGIRDLEAVVAAARDSGLDFKERVAMPANNQTLVFARS